MILELVQYPTTNKFSYLNFNNLKSMCICPCLLLVLQYTNDKIIIILHRQTQPKTHNSYIFNNQKISRSIKQNIQKYSNNCPIVSSTQLLTKNSCLILIYNDQNSIVGGLFWKSLNIFLIEMKEQKKKPLNIDDIIIRLKDSPYNDKGFAIRQGEIEGLCVMAKTIFMDQPLLLQLQPPVQICGDTHGQYQDLLTIFRIFGSPANRNYLFLGDYVDRGKQSLQCICLLLAYKIRYPLSFFLLRGNHESSELNKLYGFYDECKRRLTIRSWKLLSDTFNFLPIAAVVGGRIFCVHGGISPLIKNLGALNTIRRPMEALDNKIISDMLWADPKTTIEGWADNVERGIGYYYGRNVIDYFLTRNDFDLICRSHQVVEEGYEFAFDRRLITIFSAPNYCGEFTNLGAVLRINEEMICKLDQFEGQPAPIKKRSRTVTPLRAINDMSPKGSRQKRQESIESKARKATKIIKSQLDKNIELGQDKQRSV